MVSQKKSGTSKKNQWDFQISRVGSLDFLDLKVNGSPEIQLKHIRRDFHSVPWVMPQGWDFGVLRCPGGQKKFFSNMVMWHIKSTGMTSKQNASKIFNLGSNWWPWGFVSFVCLFCCFTSQVNSYGHGGTVSSLNHTFSWAGLNRRLTSNSCTYFRL